MTESSRCRDECSRPNSPPILRVPLNVARTAIHAARIRFAPPPGTPPPAAPRWRFQRSAAGAAARPHVRNHRRRDAVVRLIRAARRPHTRAQRHSACGVWRGGDRSCRVRPSRGGGRRAAAFRHECSRPGLPRARRIGDGQPRGRLQCLVTGRPRDLYPGRYAAGPARAPPVGRLRGDWAPPRHDSQWGRGFPWRRRRTVFSAGSRAGARRCRHGSDPRGGRPWHARRGWSHRRCGVCHSGSRHERRQIHRGWRQGCAAADDNGGSRRDRNHQDGDARDRVGERGGPDQRIRGTQRQERWHKPVRRRAHGACGEELGHLLSRSERCGGRAMELLDHADRHLFVQPRHPHQRVIRGRGPEDDSFGPLRLHGEASGCQQPDVHVDGRGLGGNGNGP